MEKELRIKAIEDAVESFRDSADVRLAMGFSIADLIMEQFGGELQNIYNSVSREELKDDLKTVIDKLYDEEDGKIKEFLAGVVLHMTRLL